MRVQVGYQTFCYTLNLRDALASTIRWPTLSKGRGKNTTFLCARFFGRRPTRQSSSWSACTNSIGAPRSPRSAEQVYIAAAPRRAGLL